MNGRSQAVRLPKAFRFDADEVYVRRTKSGDVILSKRRGSKEDWDELFRLFKESRDEAQDFLIDRGDGPPQERNLF